jgi:hypothetical protein
VVEEVDAQHAALFIMNSWGFGELRPGATSAYEAIGRRCAQLWRFDLEEAARIKVAIRYFDFLMVVASDHMRDNPWAQKAILTLCDTLQAWPHHQRKLLLMRLRAAVTEEHELQTYPLIRKTFEHLDKLGVDQTFWTPSSGHTDYKKRLLAAQALGIDPEVPDVQKVCRRLAGYGWNARPGDKIGEVVLDADVLDEILCALREGGRR